MSELKLPVLLRALGNEVRTLQRYFARGLITQDEADERLADWELFYPPGFWDIDMLADARRDPAIQLRRMTLHSEAAE